MPSEIEQHARFSQIRYAQCWEDADILISALNIQPHHVCLSIASGGENTLALLSQGPQRVIAIDLSPAQLACLELKVVAFRLLSHAEMLVLLGSRESLEDGRTASMEPSSAGDVVQLRTDLYQTCRRELSPEVRQFWDEQPEAIALGIYAIGKFERYLALFRRYVLPLIHHRDRVFSLLQSKPFNSREYFYREQWDTWRWRLLFRAFFSPFVLGQFGTDPSFLRYSQHDLAPHLLSRTRYALTQLNPAENPYLQWITLGRHWKKLPYALRQENFEPIRTHLDRLEWRCMALEDLVKTLDADTIDSYNLSDVFEFMSEANYRRLLPHLRRVGRKGGRLVYWNRLAERHRPDTMAQVLHPLKQLSKDLFRQDKVFFYGDFVVEEMV
ncbi:MAG: DUF3419 family protein [Leptolyngbyaceae cyanobacterium MO_188.B28]|nr:DUF3419 family protein [Leptolyngbyaceae cyanobacterium MO_188.B28]